MDHAFLRVYLRLVSGYPRGAPECHMVSVYSVRLCDHVPGGEPARFTSSGDLPEFYTNRVPPYVLAPPGLTAYLFGCEAEALICCSRKEEPIVIQQYIPVQCITPLSAAEVDMQMTSGRFDKKTLRPPTISQVLTHYCAKARDKNASLSAPPCSMSEVYARNGKWMRREENYIRMAYEYGQKRRQKRSASSAASNRGDMFENDPIKDLFQHGLPTPCMGFKSGSSAVLPWKVLATRNYRLITMPKKCIADATRKSTCVPRPVATHAIAEMFCGQERSPTHRQLFEVVNQLAVIARGEEHTTGPAVLSSASVQPSHSEQCTSRYRAYNIQCIEKITEALSTEDSGLSTPTIATVSPCTFLQHLRYETYAVGLDENCLVLATVYGWQVLCGALDRRTFKALAYAMVQGYGVPVTSIRFAADAMRPGHYLSPAVMSAIASHAKYVDSSPAWHTMSLLEDHALPVERPAARRDVLWDAHSRGFGRHAMPDFNSPTYAMLSEGGWVTAPSRGGAPAQPRSRLGSASHIVSRTLSTTRTGSSTHTPSTRLETYLSDMHAALAIAQNSHRDNVYVITLTDADCMLLRTLREYAADKECARDDAVCCYEQDLMGLGLMKDVSRGQLRGGNSCNIATLSTVADALLRINERERTLNFEKVFQKTLGVPQKVPEVIFYGAHMATFHEMACVFDCASAIVSAINYTRMRTRSLLNRERPRPPAMCVASTHVAIVTLASPVVQHFWAPFNCSPTNSHVPTEAVLAEIASSWLVHKVEPKNGPDTSSKSATPPLSANTARDTGTDASDRDVLVEIGCEWSEEEITDGESVDSSETGSVQDDHSNSEGPHIPVSLADAWLMSVTMEDKASAIPWEELPVLAIYDSDLEELDGQLGYYSDGPSSIAQEADAYLESGGIHGGKSSDTRFEPPLLYGGYVSLPVSDTITTTGTHTDHSAWGPSINACDVSACNMQAPLFPLSVGADKRWRTGDQRSTRNTDDTGLGLHCVYQGPDSDACAEFLRRVGIHTGDNVQASPGAYARLSVGEHVYLPETGDIGIVVKIIRPYNSSTQTLGWHCDPHWETDKASLWCEAEMRSRTVIAIQGPPVIDLPGATPDMRAIAKATENFNSFSVHHGESSCCSKGIHGDVFRRACDWIKTQGWPGTAKPNTQASCEKYSCDTSRVLEGDEEDGAESDSDASDASDDCSLDEPIREKLPTPEEANANTSMLYTGMGPGAGVTMVAAGPHHVIVGSVMIRAREYRGPTLRQITLLLFPGFSGEDIVAAAVKCIQLRVVVIVGSPTHTISSATNGSDQSRALLTTHKNCAMRIALSEYMKKGTLSPSGAVQTVTSTKDRRTNRRALASQFSL